EPKSLGGQQDGSDQKQPASHGQPRRVLVDELLRGAREVILDHDGQFYRLRLTLAGKLILTK
ncbi:MAG: hemin uptake protein HemP, partial [Hyphomicrobiaceae bacterium]